MKKFLLILGLIFLIPLALAYAANQSEQGIPVTKFTYNSSIVIAAGNTFQAILPAVNSIVGKILGRLALSIQNNNATDSCWITFGTFGVWSNGVFGSQALITAGTATKGRSILLLAGGSLTRYWPFVPGDEIEATCASTSDTLYVDVM